MSAEASSLADQRRKIDAIDAAVVVLLGQRVAVVQEMVAIKQAEGIAARLPERVETVIANVRQAAEAQACPPDLAEAVWRTIIEWTIRHEEDSLAKTSP